MSNHFERKLKFGNLGKTHGVFHMNPDTTPFQGTRFFKDGEETINFSSCSYLNLEMHHELKMGVIQATMDYGTQFSSCRTFAQCPLYEELEECLNQILGGPVIVGLSVTFSHLAALPLLIRNRSKILFDHQTHHCMRFIIDALEKRNEVLEIKEIAHSNLEKLELELEKNMSVDTWLLIDGLYSMYGDEAPIEKYICVLDKYPNFHLYVDDAHSMTWQGVQGQGFAAKWHHERLYVSSSLNKAFAAAGGMVRFPQKETQETVRLLGEPFIWGGPIQPPMLGAALASAKLHLNGTVEQYQKELLEKIKFFNDQAKMLELPLVSLSNTPIRYIGLGTFDFTCKISNLLLEKGYFVSTVCWPSVSENRTGLRVSLTREHTFSEIAQFLFELKRVLNENEFQAKTLAKRFSKAVPPHFANPFFSQTTN